MSEPTTYVSGRIMRDTPFVGRTNEIEKLLNIMGQVLLGSGRAVLILGEAGIGKTRLCEELFQPARSIGFAALRGRCLPGAPLPYLPFIDALESIDAADFKQVTSELLQVNKWPRKSDNRLDSSLPKAIEAMPESLFTICSDEQFPFYAIELFRNLSKKRPLLLLIEDLHWADSSSLQLFKLIVKNLQGLNVLLIGTYRPEDIISNEEVGGEVLREAVREIKRQRRLELIELGPLTIGDGKSMLEGMMGGNVEDKVANVLIKESGGVPFFLIEMARYMIGEGVLVNSVGQWQLMGTDIGEVPSNVRETILRRLEKLTKEERRTVDCASVIGADFDPKIILKLLNFTEMKLMDILDSVEKRSALIRMRENGYSFSHEIIRKVNYEALSNQRKKEFHAGVGDFLEANEPTTPPGILSQHFCISQNYEKCVRYSLLAGEDCTIKSAFVEAATYFQKVLNLAEKAKVEKELLIQSTESLADAYQEIGRYEEAHKLYMFSLASSADNTQKARINRKLADLWIPQKLGNGTVIKHKEFLEKAMSYENIDIKEQGEILTDYQVEALWEGDFNKAEDLAERAADLFLRAGALRSYAWELSAHGFVQVARGRPEIGLHTLEKAKEVLTRYPWPKGELYCLQHLGEALLCLGKYEEALDTFTENIERAKQLGNEYEVAWAHFYRSLCHEMLGKYEIALVESSLSYDSAISLDYRPMIALVGALCAHQKAREGSNIVASSLIDRSIKLMGEPNSLMKSPLWGVVRIIEAEVLLSEGLTEESESRFQLGYDLLHGAQLEQHYKALALMWRGYQYWKKMMFEKALDCYTQSMFLFTGLNNIYIADKLNSLIQALAK